MERKQFIKTLFGASTLLTMDGFSHIIGAVAHHNEKANQLMPSTSGNSKDFAIYGAIHLNITNLAKTTDFWTRIVGLKLREQSEKEASFGTESQTLVVVHETAKTSFRKGYSGLYHFAIHAPNQSEFASMIHRLNVHKYPYSPVDHTMSKSIYLDDPDGINIELTLETPEEFKRVVTTGGLGIEGTDGIVRSASERLDVAKIMIALKDKNVDRVISSASYIGHVHLYANNVEKSNSFYKKMGFLQFNYLPQFMYADLGAGGEYQHRIVMNSWHGVNKPLAPEGSAGMRHFHMQFRSEDKLRQALGNVPNYEEVDGGCVVLDPTGNKILLSSIA